MYVEKPIRGLESKQSVRREITPIAADAQRHAATGMINGVKGCSLPAGEHLRGVTFTPETSVMNSCILGTHYTHSIILAPVPDNYIKMRPIIL